MRLRKESDTIQDEEVLLAKVSDASPIRLESIFTALSCNAIGKEKTSAIKMLSLL